MAITCEDFLHASIRLRLQDYNAKLEGAETPYDEGVEEAFEVVVESEPKIISTPN